MTLLQPARGRRHHGDAGAAPETIIRPVGSTRGERGRVEACRRAVARVCGSAAARETRVGRERGERFDSPPLLGKSGLQPLLYGAVEHSSGSRYRAVVEVPHDRRYRVAIK
jgi:hypothetical protein